MTKPLVSRTIAVCALLAGTQLVQAACDDTEDWCLRDSYGLEGVQNSGTEFALWLTPTPDVPHLVGSIVGFADISATILPPTERCAQSRVSTSRSTIRTMRILS